MKMNTRRTSPSLEVLFAMTFVVVLSVCINSVESRPPVLITSLQGNFPDLRVSSRDFDYDYPDVILPQGPRRRRWAFPVDVQDSLCPPGERRHTSGYGCVRDEGDDY